MNLYKLYYDNILQYESLSFDKTVDKAVECIKNLGWDTSLVSWSKESI